MSKRITRRELLRRSAYVAGTIALASCTPRKATEPPTSVPATPASTEPTAVPATLAPTAPAVTPTLAPGLAGEIEYLIYDFGPEGNKAREDAAKAFMDANPGTTVKVTVLPYWENYEKFNARAAAGDPHDVVYGDWQLLANALQGQLMDLTEWFNADPVLTKPELFTFDLRDRIMAYFGTSKMFNLVQGTWVPLLFYNRDRFDEAGVAYAADEWTWDDLRVAAKALTDTANNKWGLQIGDYATSFSWLWWSLGAKEFWAIPQFFPDKTAFNQEIGLENLQLWRALGYEDKSLIPPDELSGYTSYGGAFGAGDAAMYVGGDWDAAWGFIHLPFKWGVAFFPTIKKDYRVNLNTMVSTNVIAAGTKNPDLAWAFTRYLTATVEGQTFVGVGAFEAPILKEAAHSDAVLRPEWAPPGYDARVRAAEIPGPSYCPFALAENYYEVYDKFLRPVLNKVSTGEVMPEEAAKQLDEVCTPYYQEKKANMPPIP